jgi:hypothetical protein
MIPLRPTLLCSDLAPAKSGVAGTGPSGFEPIVIEPTGEYTNTHTYLCGRCNHFTTSFSTYKEHLSRHSHTSEGTSSENVDPVVLGAGAGRNAPRWKQHGAPVVTNPDGTHRARLPHRSDGKCLICWAFFNSCDKSNEEVDSAIAEYGCEH